MSLLNELMQRERDLLVQQFSSCKASREDLYNHERRLEHMLLAALNERTNQIMSAIADFAAKVQANFDKLSGDLDGIKTEITDLNTQIQNLQNSSGTLSASDQAALDTISAKSQSLQDKADALVVPPTPPAPTPAP